MYDAAQSAMACSRSIDSMFPALLPVTAYFASGPLQQTGNPGDLGAGAGGGDGDGGGGFAVPPASVGWPQNWISSRPAWRRGLCRNRTRLQMRFHGFRTHPKRHRK